MLTRRVERRVHRAVHSPVVWVVGLAAVLLCILKLLASGVEDFQWPWFWH
jgi:hypothetical protein